MKKYIIAAFIIWAIILAFLAFVSRGHAAIREKNLEAMPVIEQYQIIAPKGDYRFSDFGYSGNRLTIPVKDLRLSRGRGNSMLPLSGDGTWIITTGDFDHARLKAGDFVVVETAGMPVYWHQIVEIGQDAQGRYYITKGVNNPQPDLWPVRDAEIKYLVIGVIW